MDYDQAVANWVEDPLANRTVNAKTLCILYALEAECSRLVTQVAARLPALMGPTAPDSETRVITDTLLSLKRGVQILDAWERELRMQTWSDEDRRAYEDWTEIERTRARVLAFPPPDRPKD